MQHLSPKAPLALARLRLRSMRSATPRMHDRTNAPPLQLTAATLQLRLDASSSPLGAAPGQPRVQGQTRRAQVH